MGVFMAMLLLSLGLRDVAEGSSGWTLQRNGCLNKLDRCPGVPGERRGRPVVKYYFDPFTTKCREYLESEDPEECKGDLEPLPTTFFWPNSFKSYEECHQKCIKPIEFDRWMLNRERQKFNNDG